jgi:hypothetical protein
MEAGFILTAILMSAEEFICLPGIQPLRRKIPRILHQSLISKFSCG